MKISYIAADLNYIDSKLLEDKNILYNYLMKTLISKIITEKDRGAKINILCDNKTTKVASKNSLGDYIKLYLNYECGYALELNILFKDSDAGDEYIIQAADYVANAIYTHYEYNNSIYKNLMITKYEIEDEFPRYKFGK